MLLTKPFRCRAGLRSTISKISRGISSASCAVLAVLFLSQAVERAGDLDLLKLAGAFALMITALALFLFMRVGKKE